MALVNINDIQTPEELERIARRDLEGKTLAEIAETIRESDRTARVSSKAGVGYVIEEGYLGIGQNNVKGADIPHLDVEVKSSALKTAKDGLLRSKEPVSLNIINYMEEHANGLLKESSLYRKNRNILFVFYVHDKEKERSEYLIKYVFLWKMDEPVIAELEPDYRSIIAKVRSGNVHSIHQRDHEYLTLCPKHGGTFRDPNDKRSKTRQPFSDAPAEVRAYRLKCRYVNKLIQRELAKRGPSALAEFVPAK